MKSEILSLKIIVRELNFFKENNYHSMKRLKKDFLQFANKLMEKYLILAIRRNTVSHL